MSNWLATAPMDLFNADHNIPRHSPGTKTKYAPKDGGPSSEYMYVQVKKTNSINPTTRRVVYSKDEFNGVAYTSTTSATEAKALGVLVSPTITDGNFTWIRTKGKGKVQAYGTFVAGNELMPDASGYLTDRAGDAKQTAGIALAPTVGSNAAGATDVYVDASF